MTKAGLGILTASMLCFSLAFGISTLHALGAPMPASIYSLTSLSLSSVWVTVSLFVGLPIGLVVLVIGLGKMAVAARAQRTQ